MRNKSNDAFLKGLDQGFSVAGVLPQHSIVCAVSGGADSVALLLGAQRLQHRFASLTAAHFNHRIRGEESDGDEEFVRNLCANAGIAFYVDRSQRSNEHLDENSARKDRYDFLAKTADEVGADAILLAHTIEDQAETVLLRIARGTGLRGAGGMRASRSMLTPSSRKIKIFRPMLQITHREAQDFLHAIQITARHDSTNDDSERYARNRIRHRVIPELQALNPEAISAIARFATIMKSNSDFIDEQTCQAMRESATKTANVHLRSHVAQLHPVVGAAVLTEMHSSLSDADSQLDTVHLTKLLELIKTGKSSSYDLPGSATLNTDHQFIRMKRSGTVPNDVVPYPHPIDRPAKLPVPGRLDLGNGFAISSALVPCDEEIQGSSSDEAWLNPQIVVDDQLEVRNRKRSDRFNPLGMNQNVDLADFLIKAKVAASWRDRIPLVAMVEDGRIVWLPGVRPAEWAKLLPLHQTALRLRFERDTSEN